jgi:hypothetical protein
MQITLVQTTCKFLWQHRTLIFQGLTECSYLVERIQPTFQLYNYLTDFHRITKGQPRWNYCLTSLTHAWHVQKPGVVVILETTNIK